MRKWEKAVSIFLWICVGVISLAVVCAWGYLAWNWIVARKHTPKLSDPGESVYPGDRFTLRWTPVKGARYRLQESTNKNFRKVAVKRYGDMTVARKTITAPAVAKDDTFYYRVYALYPDEREGHLGPTGKTVYIHSNWSNVVDMKVKCIRPPTLTSDKASVVPGEKFTLSWDAISRADCYTLEVKCNDTQKPAIVPVVNWETITAPVPPDKNDAVYSYRVKAIKKGKDITVFSNMVSVKVKYVSPPSLKAIRQHCWTIDGQIWPQ